MFYGELGQTKLINAVLRSHHIWILINCYCHVKLSSKWDVSYTIYLFILHPFKHISIASQQQFTFSILF